MENITPDYLYKDYLSTLSISDLRVLARNYGVPKSTTGTKEWLVEEITAVLLGKADPVPRSNRGAPVKQSYIDPNIIQTLIDIRRDYESRHQEPKKMLEVATPNPRPETFHVSFNTPIHKGILEITSDGNGYLRVNCCNPFQGQDVLIPAETVRSMDLREGDAVVCTATEGDELRIGKLFSVNDDPVGFYENRPVFEQLTVGGTTEKVVLSKSANCDSVRLLDLFAPLGKGQRGLIVAPPKSGKTELLFEIAASILANHRTMHLIVLLFDALPEEAEKFRSLEFPHVFVSNQGDYAQRLRMAKLSVSNAKHMAEQGRKVVFIVDSLSALARAYLGTADGASSNGEMRTLKEVKRVFDMACNTTGGSSITVLATLLSDTGNPIDEAVFRELCGTVETEIYLQPDPVERDDHPVIDLMRSHTRSERELQSKAELSGVKKLREQGVASDYEGMLSMLRTTADNREFLTKLSDLLKDYRLTKDGK